MLAPPALRNAYADVLWPMGKAACSRTQMRSCIASMCYDDAHLCEWMYRLYPRTRKSLHTYMPACYMSKIYIHWCTVCSFSLIDSIARAKPILWFENRGHVYGLFSVILFFFYFSFFLYSFGCYSLCVRWLLRLAMTILTRQSKLFIVKYLIYYYKMHITCCARILRLEWWLDCFVNGTLPRVSQCVGFIVYRSAMGRVLAVYGYWLLTNSYTILMLFFLYTIYICMHYNYGYTSLNMIILKPNAVVTIARRMVWRSIFI